MPKNDGPYPAEFRGELVALVRAGRTPEDTGARVRTDRPVHQSLVAYDLTEDGRRTDGGSRAAEAQSPKH